MHAQAAVADQRSALHRLYEAADRQAREVDRVRAARAAAPDQPTREELEARGPAEGLDPADVIAKRRRVEHAAHLAGLDAQVQAAASRAEQIAEQIAAIEGELVTVFEITVTRSARLRHYHERRAAVYRRWHRRAWHRRARGSSSVPEWPLHDADATIPVPAWTTEPCPWVHPRATAASAAA